MGEKDDTWADRQKYVRGTISPQVRDGVVLNLSRLDTYFVPVSWSIHVVYVAPLDLVRAECGPPDVTVGELGQQHCDTLWHNRRAADGLIGDGGNKVQKVVVC